MFVTRVCENTCGKHVQMHMTQTSQDKNPEDAKEETLTTALTLRKHLNGDRDIRHSLVTVIGERGKTRIAPIPLGSCYADIPPVR
jgi:hypothetical protein